MQQHFAQFFDGSEQVETTSREESSSSDKPKDFEEITARTKVKQMKTFSYIPEKASLTCYKIAQLLCQKKKACIEAESVILPSILIAVEIMLGSKFLTQMKKIHLSNNTISRRIQDNNDQVQDMFTTSDDPFLNFCALQVDKSTDISNKAQLIAYNKIRWKRHKNKECFRSR